MGAALQLKALARRFPIPFALVLIHVIAAILRRLKARSVRGWRVLITGAGSGLGRNLALRFAKKGSNLVLWDVNDDGLKETKRQIAQCAPNVTVATKRVDVSDKSHVDKAAEEAKEDGGQVDCLVLNAGVVAGNSFLEEKSEAKIRQVFGVNVLQLFWVTQAFLADMIKRNMGHIVTISSASGVVGVPRLVDYSSSKFAAYGFGESLRLELKKRGATGVKTSLICPFYINTGMFDGASGTVLMDILKEDYAASSILSSVENGQPLLCMPELVRWATYAAKLLPIETGDWIFDILGFSTTMDQFKGRAAA